MRVCVLAAAAALAAATSCTTWYDTTKHGPGFRNVMDYGAVGDGVTDDSAAINKALTEGRNPTFSTLDPTTVYFPPGTYLVKATLPLPIYFYTFLTGSWCDPPTILLPEGAGYGGFVFDSDIGDEGGEHTDEFYRGFSNFNVVLAAGNPKSTGIHWAQSQATHVRNVTFTLDPEAQTAMFMENGSGGFMSDIAVTGGQTGLSLGNQQWTYRSITVSGCAQNCIYFYWDWAFVFVDLHLSNCPTGIFAQGNAFGSVQLLDSSFSNVTTGVLTDYPNDQYVRGVLLDRVTATNTNTITNGYPGNPTGTVFVSSWAQGVVFVNSTLASSKQTALPQTRPNVPLPTVARPWSPPGGGAVVNVYDHGAVGNGVADDTAAIQAAINAAPAGGGVFLPQGMYLVSNTIVLKPDTFLMGEALSEIHPSSAAAVWQSASNPAPVLLLPQGGSPIIAEIIFVTVGNVPGAIMLAWQSGPGTSLYDVHWRTMHTTWAMLHISGSTAGGLLENSWAWVADHDINSGNDITVDNPRGILVENAQGPLYLYGSAAEHSAMFQYNFTNAANVVQLVAQTETPYWQYPATAPASIWDNSRNMALYGAAFWNWNCQFAPANQPGCNSTLLFQWTSSSGYAFGVNTVGSNTVVGGDISVPAYGPPTMNWFTSLAMGVLQQSL